MLSLICSCFYPEPRHGGIYTYDGECAAGAPAARAREKPAPLASLARLPVLGSHGLTCYVCLLGLIGRASLRAV